MSHASLNMKTKPVAPDFATLARTYRLAEIWLRVLGDSYMQIIDDAAKEAALPGIYAQADLTNDAAFALDTALGLTPHKRPSQLEAHIQRNKARTPAALPKNRRAHSKSHP
jgi:hypothetical protein